MLSSDKMNQINRMVKIWFFKKIVATVIYLVKPIAQHSRNQIPLNKGGKGVVGKLAKTCPHETRPRKNGEWGKDVFTE